MLAQHQPSVKLRNYIYDERLDVMAAEPASKLMTISPKIAEHFLSTSPGNRPISQVHVARLAGAMRRGEWQVTNQGIGFDVNGDLRDGHHRLTAIIESGCHVEMIVTVGMPVAAYEVIDTGNRRSYSDLLGEPSKLTEIWRLGVALSLGKESYKPTTSEMRPFISGKFGEVSRQIMEIAGTTRKILSSVPVRLAAVVSILDGADPEFVFRQYRALVNLDYDAMSASSKMFCRLVQNNKLSATGGRMQILAIALKVFDQTKAHVERLVVGQNEVSEAPGIVRRVLLRHTAQA